MFVDINKYYSSKNTIILIKGEISYHEKQRCLWITFSIEIQIPSLLQFNEFINLESYAFV